MEKLSVLSHAVLAVYEHVSAVTVTNIKETWQFSAVLYSFYWVALVVGGAILPGGVHKGAPLEDGTRKSYKCNGWSLFISVYLSYFFGAWMGLFNGGVIYDNFAGLCFVVNIFAVLQTFFLYFRAKYFNPAEFDKYSSGNLLLDLWMGTELNPTLFGLDLKFFAYRPAMMGWALVNLSFAFKQESITTPMLLYQIFTFIYVFDYFWLEHYIVTTWDIIEERFGYMLVFGDYVFITFCFGVQNWFLVDAADDMSCWYTTLCCAVFVVGYVIFRGANLQKHQFKEKGRELYIWGKPVQVLERKNGGMFLISGFWGMARKMNYTGDILLALSYCLPTRTASVLGYFYFIYLFTLLMHRARRDERRLVKKYPEDWEEYRKIVPYRFIPFVY